MASFFAAAFARLGLEASPDTVTLAAVIIFLPGMALTIGVCELATEHLQSGVANTARALVQLLQRGLHEPAQAPDGRDSERDDAGFNTFVTAMSIAYGLMLSSLVVPRRFTQFGVARE
jgi:uncharacterized membrane protein YjjB (DUF3815 family)